MARLYLVRHGEAAAGFGEHDDPGLSDLGKSQAAATAKTLGELGLKDSISSPLLRCQETAAPFVALTGRPFRIEDAVAEIPTPKEHQHDRQTWLRGVMMGKWGAQTSLAPWRERLIKTLTAVENDLVVFSHFVAINIAVGAATGNDDVRVFAPANGSVTILESTGAGLKFVSFGVENSGTKVL